MSETTAPAACTEAEFNMARKAGWLVVTTADEVAVHKFAEAIRAQVGLHDLSPAIVKKACDFTDANDRSDSAADFLQEGFDEDDFGPEATGLMQAIQAADDDYNRTKRELFALCRPLVAARLGKTLATPTK